MQLLLSGGSFQTLGFRALGLGTLTLANECLEIHGTKIPLRGDRDISGLVRGEQGSGLIELSNYL